MSQTSLAMSGTLSQTEEYASLGPDSSTTAGHILPGASAEEVHAPALGEHFNFCVLHMTFVMLGLKQSAQPAMDQLLELARAEEECIFYRFTVTEGGSSANVDEMNSPDGKLRLMLRAAYVDGAALNTHACKLISADGTVFAPVLAKLVTKPSSGPQIAKLESCEFQGPKTELIKLDRSRFANILKPQYWNVHSGFCNVGGEQADKDQDLKRFDFITLHSYWEVVSLKKAEPALSEALDMCRHLPSILYAGFLIHEDGKQLMSREAHSHGDSVKAYMADPKCAAAIGRLAAPGVCKVIKSEIHGPPGKAGLDACRRGPDLSSVLAAGADREALAKFFDEHGQTYEYYELIDNGLGNLERFGMVGSGVDVAQGLPSGFLPTERSRSSNHGGA